MDIGSILLILALFILVALFITRPLFEPRSVQATGEVALQDHKLSSLKAERDRVLNALQELDFDNALGKIPEAEYPAQRARLMEYGAGVLRQIDELEAAAGNSSSSDALDADARLEAAIVARAAMSGHGAQPAAGGTSRAQGNGVRNPAAAVAAPDDDLEVILASRRRARQEKSAGFCPRCGNPVRQSDQFCPKCGARIGEADNISTSASAGSNGKSRNGNPRTK